VCVWSRGAAGLGFWVLGGLSRGFGLAQRGKGTKAQGQRKRRGPGKGRFGELVWFLGLALSVDAGARRPPRPHAHPHRTAGKEARRIWRGCLGFRVLGFGFGPLIVSDFAGVRLRRAGSAGGEFGTHESSAHARRFRSAQRVRNTLGLLGGRLVSEWSLVRFRALGSRGLFRSVSVGSTLLGSPRSLGFRCWFPGLWQFGTSSRSLHDRFQSSGLRGFSAGISKDSTLWPVSNPRRVPDVRDR